MASGIERAGGGRIMPALRYRNAGAAIDWLCKAFGFEKKMAVPTEDGRIAYAELVLGNGMIMLGDAKAEYGSLVRPPGPPQRVNTQERRHRQQFEGHIWTFGAYDRWVS